MRLLVVGSVLAAALMGGSREARADGFKCGSTFNCTDIGLAALRTQVDVRCPCATQSSQKAYKQCYKQVIKESSLNKQCKKAATMGAKFSTCGRAGTVACNKTNKSGKTTCTIKKSADKCKGTATDGFVSCADACPASGPELPACPANTAGGADEIVFTVLDHGTDLDNGWTGTSQNFPVPSGSQLKYCLSGCNATDQPVCQGTGSTGGVAGQDSLNGNTFGPPLPLIAGGVPVCVINRFNGDITGTSDLSTGAQTGTVNLFSDVFVTDATRVCPRCNGGKCDSGRNANQNCTVDGMVNVAESLAPDKNFALSRDCPPAGSPVGTLNITLPLTTGTDGTPGTGASKPCREREAQGVPVKDDSCGGAGCGAPCQGKSCTSMAPSPIDPNTMVCIDSKGGISQLCCNNDPTTPCFATAPGGVGISRTGRPLPPQPAWPADQTYPKTASGVVIVATFCEAASGAFNVDQVTGLPGPGAVIFNTKTDYLKAP